MYFIMNDNDGKRHAIEYEDMLTLTHRRIAEITEFHATNIKFKQKEVTFTINYRHAKASYTLLFPRGNVVVMDLPKPSTAWNTPAMLKGFENMKKQKEI